ncbi:hypothetical protein K435DRAFT_863739 [Dendrothele bispora CBS 962.96]|uniref:Uncharacterized protein n=1 Tax=Dendrothele bispora (strain CBS 962.96) TaxID=1314807 RepID=A0A4S8LP00_DENBC|nr:hypothetical protein K435DRAFT_863739 [Dendrothele bispora CBS 962.96]
MSQPSVENYSTDPADLEAIRAHRDKEVAAGHRLEALPEDFHLLPGMKVPPILNSVEVLNSILLAIADIILKTGIDLHDLYAYFDDSRSFPLVQATICGSKKVRGDPIHCKPPLRTSHIQSLVDKATHTRKYDDLLFATIITCPFYGCHCTGELVMPNCKALCDWRKIIKHSMLRFDGGCAGYHLPYHKADPFHRGTEILFTAQEVGNPVQLLQNYATVGQVTWCQSCTVFA